MHFNKHSQICILIITFVLYADIAQFVFSVALHFPAERAGCYILEREATA